MRTSVLLAACAAVVFASPVPEEVVVTHTDVDYVTKIVTVTAGAEAAPTVAAAPSASYKRVGWFKKHRKTRTRTAQPAPTSYNPPAGTPPASTPAPSNPAPSDPAPVPAPSDSAPAPPPAYTAPAPAPSSSQAPPPPPASSQAPPSSPAEPPASTGIAKTFKDAVVLHHNLARARHGSPDLKWDAEMARSAQAVADTCKYEHKMDASSTKYGQNIAAGVSPGLITSTITDMFYADEEPKYANFYDSSSFTDAQFATFGHFTQVVWAGTGSVGCAVTDCGTRFQKPIRDANGKPTGAYESYNLSSNKGQNNYFTVCNYGPPGNYAGQYQKNVARPKTATYGVTGLSQCDQDAILADWKANQNAATY